MGIGGDRKQKQTQEQAILGELQRHRNQWVAAYVLAQHALQYASRISGLRKKGHRILNRVERVNGQVHGAYMLADDITPTRVTSLLPTGNNEPTSQLAFHAEKQESRHWEHD